MSPAMLDGPSGPLAMAAADAASPGSARLEIRFSPSVTLISGVRRFVSQFYEEVLGDPDIADRVALATHELLENASRYSVDGETRTLLEIVRTPQTSVSVRTWNRATPAQIFVLHGMFDDMARSGDAFEYYQAAMRRTAKSTRGSGLGLARVWAEANMALTLAEEYGWVIIHAEFKIDPEPTR